MCLLITTKKNKMVKKQYLQNAYNSNRDGCGFAHVGDSQIVIKKFREFNEFYNSYELAFKEYGHSSEFIIHFRLTTHGETNGTFNVHPFRVHNDLVFAHNGIISNAKHDNKKSDTRMFNEEILQTFKTQFLIKSLSNQNGNIGFIKLIKQFIGHSKLAFLDKMGNTYLINEHMGNWENGIWYSNSSHKSCGISYGNYGGYSFNWNQSKKTKVHKNKFKIKSKKQSKYFDGVCDWCYSKTKVQNKTINAYNNQLCKSCIEFDASQLNDELGLDDLGGY